VQHVRQNEGNTGRYLMVRNRGVKGEKEQDG
jgi:hypothetical protein